MKNGILKFVLTASMAVLATGAFAQQNFGSAWGATPQEQEQNVINYNLFRDAYSAKEYGEAMKYLPSLLSTAPKSTQNLYINAANLLDNMILRAQSLQEKNRLIDTLMMVYDMRIQHFGDQPQSSAAHVLKMKAQAYLDYKSADRVGIHNLFKQAIEAGGQDVDLNFVNIYFNELTSDYKADEIELDQYMDEYEKLEALFNLPANADKTEERTTFEALFMNSGAANCENLQAMLAPRIEANPTDAALLKKAVQNLTRAKCKNDFYFDVAEKYYAVDPSSETALILAAGFEEAKDYAKALQYLNAAMASETDLKMKENLGIRLAASELGAGNARSSADYARQVIAMNSGNGVAYYFLAQAYSAGTNQCSGFERQSTFWLIYDTLAQARRLLESDPDSPIKVSDIDSEMARYRASFPSKEECFFRGLSDGMSFQVRCGWVGGSTSVRQGR